MNTTDPTALPFGLDARLLEMAQALSDQIDADVAERVHRRFLPSATRADILKLSVGAPMGVIQSGPFKGRVYIRSLTGGIVRVK